MRRAAPPSRSRRRSGSPATRPRSAPAPRRQSTRVWARSRAATIPSTGSGERSVLKLCEMVLPTAVIAEGVVRCTSLSVTPRTTIAWRKSPAATMPAVSGCSVGSRYHCTVRPVSATRPTGNTPCPPVDVVRHRPRVRDRDPAQRAHDRADLGELDQQHVVHGHVQVALEQADRTRDAVEAQHVAQPLRARHRHGRGHGQDLDGVARPVDAREDHRAGHVLVRVDARRPAWSAAAAPTGTGVSARCTGAATRPFDTCSSCESRPYSHHAAAAATTTTAQTARNTARRRRLRRLLGSLRLTSSGPAGAVTTSVSRSPTGGADGVTPSSTRPSLTRTASCTTSPTPGSMRIPGYFPARGEVKRSDRGPEPVKAGRERDSRPGSLR